MKKTHSSRFYMFPYQRSWHFSSQLRTCWLIQKPNISTTSLHKILSLRDSNNMIDNMNKLLRKLNILSSTSKIWIESIVQKDQQLHTLKFDIKSELMNWLNTMVLIKIWPEARWFSIFNWKVSIWKIAHKKGIELSNEQVIFNQFKMSIQKKKDNQKD